MVGKYPGWFSSELFSPFTKCLEHTLESRLGCQVEESSEFTRRTAKIHFCLRVFSQGLDGKLYSFRPGVPSRLWQSFTQQYLRPHFFFATVESLPGCCGAIGQQIAPQKTKGRANPYTVHANTAAENARSGRANAFKLTTLAPRRRDLLVKLHCRVPIESL